MRWSGLLPGGVGFALVFSVLLVTSTVAVAAVSTPGSEAGSLDADGGDVALPPPDAAGTDDAEPDRGPDAAGTDDAEPDRGPDAAGTDGWKALHRGARPPPLVESSLSMDATPAVGAAVPLTVTVAPRARFDDATVTLPHYQFLDLSERTFHLGDVAPGEPATFSLSATALAAVDRELTFTMAGTDDGRPVTETFVHGFDLLGDDPRVTALQVADATSSQASVASLAASSRDTTVTGRFMYRDRNGDLQPARDVTVKLIDDEFVNSEVVVGQTDRGGNFSLSFDGNSVNGGSTATVFLQFEARNDAAYASNGPLSGRIRADTITFPINPGTTRDRGTIVPADDMPAWQALDWVLDEYLFIEDRTGWTRRPLEIQVPQGNWPVFRYYAGLDGVIDPGHGEIHLPDRSDNDWGRATIYHEYAHAVHMATFDYRMSNRPSKGSYECHFLLSETDPGFATIEGWAAFMTAAVDEDPSMVSDGGNVETNAWFDRNTPNPTCSNDETGPGSDAGDFDGNRVEGSFASILYDVLDDRNETGDDIDRTFAEVFDIVDRHDVQDMADFWRHYPYDRNALARTFYEYGILRDDVYEDNDDFWSATLLGREDSSLMLNGRELRGIAVDGDDDYYEIDLSPGTVFNASLVFDQDDADLDMALYDPGRSLVRYTSSSTDNETLGAMVRENGTYYVRVYGSGSAPYRLTARTLPGLSEDRYEDNDGGGSNAAPVQVGAYERLFANSVLDDSDFYAFDVDARSMVEVDLHFDDDRSDLTLVANGLAGTRIARSDTNRDTETVRFYAERAGTYEVGVLGDPNGMASYELRWYVEGERDASIEPNDDRASAWQTSPPVTFTDYHLPPGDVDVYAFDAGASGQVNVTVDYEGGVPSVRVLDATGGVVAELDTDRGRNSSLVSLSSAGTYYVAVAYGGTGWVEYTLSLATGVGPGTTGAVNNDFGSATRIEPGWYDGLTLSRSDIADYFAVEATAGDVVSATVYFPDNATRDRVNVSAHAPNGDHIEGGQPDGDDVDVVFQAPANGTYYVRNRLIDVTGGELNYSIGVSVFRDDEYEENDGVASAPYVLGNVTLAKLVEGDTDAYAFYLRANDTLSTRTANIAFFDRGTLDLTLVHENGTTLAGAAATPGDWTPLNYTADADGTVYVLVESRSVMTTVYSITVSGAGLPPSILDDVDEAERVLPVMELGSGDGETEGQTGDGETDTYLVDLAAGQYVNVSLLGDRIYKFPMVLLGPDGEIRAQSSQALSYLAEADGTYRLRVGGGFPSAYRFDLGVAWADSDRYEDNDRLADAPTLPPGRYENLALDRGDRDYYAVSLVRGQRIAVDLPQVEASGPVEVALLDPEGRVLARRGTDGDYRPIELTVKDGGAYYVRVAPATGADGPVRAEYALDVALELPDNDRFEPNDGVERAVPLVEGELTDLRIAAGDTDLFRVDLERGERLVADLGFDQSVGNLDFALIDAEGRQVAVGAGEVDDETLAHVARHAGTYYLEVSGQRGAAAPYTLSTERSPPLADDRYEDNDDRETATPVKLGTHRDLRVLGTDVDVFAADLDAGERLRVTLTFPVVDGDLDVGVYGPDGDPLGAGRTTTDDETVTVVAETGGTHYVRVAPVGEAWTTYTMRLDRGVGNGDGTAAGAVSLDGPTDGDDSDAKKGSKDDERKGPKDDERTKSKHDERKGPKDDKQQERPTDSDEISSGDEEEMESGDDGRPAGRFDDRGIVDREHDLTITGAICQGLLQQFVFGPLSEQVCQ